MDTGRTDEITVGDIYEARNGGLFMTVVMAGYEPALYKLVCIKKGTDLDRVGSVYAHVTNIGGFKKVGHFDGI